MLIPKDVRPVPTNPPPIEMRAWYVAAGEQRKPLTAEQLRSYKAGVFKDHRRPAFRYNDDGLQEHIDLVRVGTPRSLDLNEFEVRVFNSALDAMEEGIRLRATKPKMLEAEKEKQRVLAVQEELEKRGIPSTHDTGPIHTILKMADFKTPKGATMAGRRSLHRKLGQTKKTRKHRRSTRRRA